MFKPEHFDELSLLLSSINWQSLVSDPNSDEIQDWIAKVHGILWEFDGPSAEDFQKKIIKEIGKEKRKIETKEEPEPGDSGNEKTEQSRTDESKSNLKFGFFLIPDYLRAG